ncbi:MAG: diaminopimelate decarboxylase [Chitinivibrionales bacterium]
MSEKKLPFSYEEIKRITEEYSTPFHIYDEKGILEHAASLNSAFSRFQGFREFFAVKACPNPFIMKVLKSQGFGVDCSSLTELMLAQECGFSGEDIMFSSNDTPEDEFLKARELGAVINLDDITHIETLENSAGLPDLISFRYNPGSLKKGNEIIGKPEEAKYGLTHEQIIEAYGICKAKGVKRFGVHTMVASNELNPEYFVETADILFSLIKELNQRHGISIEFANIGGGIGIPYKPEEKGVDYNTVAQGIGDRYKKHFREGDPVKLFMECGRVITGPYGYLVSRVRHIKNTYKRFAGLDACMADLMRPGMYGAYHHITVPGKDELPITEVYDITGSLCENIDKFAVDRRLPELEKGDIIVIHDTGAHGYAMGFNYNGKLRSKELLLRSDRSVMEIRREERPEDYFATIDRSRLQGFGG